MCSKKGMIPLGISMGLEIIVSLKIIDWSIFDGAQSFRGRSFKAIVKPKLGGWRLRTGWLGSGLWKH
ncbi:hypothetical protein GCM10027217_33480 [Pseudomaricurvus hydrocarbonicus]